MHDISQAKEFNFSGPKRDKKRLSLHFWVDTPEKIALVNFLDSLSESKMLNSWAVSALLTQFQNLSKARLDDPAVISALAEKAIIDTKTSPPSGKKNVPAKSNSNDNTLSTSETPANDDNGGLEVNHSNIINKDSTQDNNLMQENLSKPLLNEKSLDVIQSDISAPVARDFSKYKSAFSVKT